MQDFKSVCFINGRVTPPFFQGGDGVYINNILHYLNIYKDISVKCIGCLDETTKVYTPEEITYFLEINKLEIVERTNQYIHYKIKSNYECILYLNVSVFLSKGIASIKLLKEDVIFTQINFSHLVIQKNAKGKKVPLVHFVHDTHKLNDLSLNIKAGISLVIFNSQFTSNYFKSRLSKEVNTLIMYPTVQNVYQEKKDHSKKILLVNPVEHKGSEMMVKLVKALPQYQFIIQFNYDTHNLEKFKALANTDVRIRTFNMNEVYNLADILVVPSLFDESFGMVVIEAQAHGIPVVASNKGGLPKAVGDGGVLINDYDNIETWTYSITNILTDDSLYLHFSQKAIRNSAKYLVDTQVNLLLNEIRTTL